MYNFCFFLSVQQLASLCLVELCKSISGEDGCSVADPEEIEVLLKGLESSSTVLRFSVLKGLSNLTFVLPQADDDTELSNNVLRRLFIAKFDPDEENAALGQRYVMSIRLSVCPSVILSHLVHKRDKYNLRLKKLTDFVEFTLLYCKNNEQTYE